MYVVVPTRPYVVEAVLQITFYLVNWATGKRGMKCLIVHAYVDNRLAYVCSKFSPLHNMHTTSSSVTITCQEWETYVERHQLLRIRHVHTLAAFVTIPTALGL